MPVISAAQARALLPDITGTAEDSVLTVIIGAADAQIARHLGLATPTAGVPTLGSSAYVLSGVDLIVSEDGDTIIPRVLNVTAVASLWSSARRVFDDDSLVDPDDYTITGDMIEVLPDSSIVGVSTARNAVKVALTAGWATLPDDLGRAVAMHVKHLWNLRRSQGQSSTSEGGSSISLRDETIPAAVVQMLAPYRIPTP